MSIEAVSCARELVNDFQILEPPVDIFTLLEFLEVDLEFRPLGSSTAGSCLFIPEGQVYTVVLNSNHPWQRRRFTAGHELKHALLDHAPSSVVHTKREVAQLERAADSFASALLLPDSLLNLMCDAYGFRSAEVVSRVFGVSRLAAIYKVYGPIGKKLGRKEYRKALKEEEGRLLHRFLYTAVPPQIEHWKALKCIASDSNLGMNHCLICCSVIYNHMGRCWACGHSGSAYIGMPPADIVSSCKGELKPPDIF